MNDPAKILIVEDESIVAFNLQQRLELMGYEVAGVADTGAESLALVAEHKPDLVLMDMGMLIDALLNMTKLSRQALQLVPVDLSQIASELVPLLRESDPLRQAEFHIEPGLTAQADPVLIRSVLDNLLRNAWKFSARRPLTRITVGRCEHNGKLAFFVQDNGCGFGQEHAQRLFNPFFRLHSEREFSGTGLGLSIVERIVNRHGGQVWADAVPDQGATFYFTLGA